MPEVSCCFFRGPLNIAMNIISRLHQIWDVLQLSPFDVSSEEGRSKERYRLIALSSASSLIVKLLTSLLGLVTVPLTILYLGKEQFGLWMVVSSLVVWLQLADFGIVNGLTNALAEAHGRDDTESACSYISTAFAATALVTIFCLPIIMLLALWLPWGGILNISDVSLVQLASRCFLVAGVVFLVGLPLSVINRVFIAYQLGYVTNVSQIVSSLFSLVGLLISIWLKLSVPWLVLLVSSGPMLGNLALCAIAGRYLPWYRIKWKFVTHVALRRVLHSSVPLFIFQIGALLVNQMVNVVIARVGTLSMVADYNVLLKAYMLIFALGISFSAPFYPAIREAYEKREKRWVLRSIYRVIAVRLGVLIPPSIVLLFIGDWLIHAWIRQPLGEKFGIFGWLAFLASLLLAATSSTLSEILASLDDIWSQIKVVFVSATVVLIGMYYLIPIIGLSGVFMSMAAATLYPIVWSYLKLNRKIVRDMA